MMLLSAMFSAGLINVSLTKTESFGQFVARQNFMTVTRPTVALATKLSPLLVLAPRPGNIGM